MKSWVFIGLLISILCSGAYYYYTTTQDTIRSYIEENSSLKYNNDTLVDVNEKNIQTITDLEQQQQRIREDYQILQREFSEIRSNNNLLREKLSEHELDYLAYSKPDLIESIINNGSKNASRCFEILTGSPLTEKELNAKTEKQFNSECPWLWPGNDSP